MIIERIKRFFDRDTTIEKTYNIELTEYTITHLNGNVSTRRAHHDLRNNGFLDLYVEDEDVWAMYTTRSYSDKAFNTFNQKQCWQKVDTFEGIERVVTDSIGRIELTLTVDMAEHKIVDISREFHKY